MLLYMLTLLLTVSACLATSTQPVPAAPTPEIQENQQFTLIAKVKESELGLDIHNWVMGGTHIGAGMMAAVFSKAAPLDRLAGRLYQNGSTKDTSCGVGTNNVVAAGTGATPYTFNINPAPSGDNSTVTINIARGTQGTGIVKDGSGSPYFVGNGQLDGQFYVCNLTLWAGPLQALYWRAANEPSPSGCADIKLVPQCAGNLDNTTLYTQDLASAPCLSDAVNDGTAHVVPNPTGDGQVIVPFQVQS